MAYTGPVWKGNRTVASITVNSNLTWSTSTHSAGDTGFIAIACPNNNAQVSSAGWTLVPGVDAGVGTAGSTTAARIRLWRKDTPLLAPASEPLTVIDNVSDHAIVCAFALSPGIVLDTVSTPVIEGSGGSSTLNFPAITTGGPNRLVLNILTDAQDAAGTRFAQGVTNASLASLTQQFGGTEGGTGGNGSGLSIITGTKEAAGSTGSTTGTHRYPSVARAYLTLAFKLASQSDGGGVTRKPRAHAFFIQ